MMIEEIPMNAGTIESVFQEFACPSLNINVNAWLVPGSKASQSDVDIMKTERRDIWWLFAASKQLSLSIAYKNFC